MQILNLFIGTVASTMSIIVLVVALMHYIYLDLKPELIRSIPKLWLTAVIFGVLGAVGWFSAWARANKHSHTLWIEAGMLIVAASSFTILIAAYR